MSIVVAVKKNNKIVIASDSMYTAGSQKINAEYKINNRKLFSVGKSWLGIVGWTAIEHALENIIRKHKNVFDLKNRNSIFETSLKLQKILEEEYHLETKEEDEQPVGSSHLNCLIVNNNGIFELDSYREVNEYSKFWAIGSGENYALGSLVSTYDILDDPTEIAQQAIKAACEFDESCGLPLISEAIQTT